MSELYRQKGWVAQTGAPGVEKLKNWVSVGRGRRLLNALAPGGRVELVSSVKQTWIESPDGAQAVAGVAGGTCIRLPKSFFLW
jgi:hypothetical protein